jgi:hypothetical protein
LLSRSCVSLYQVRRPASHAGVGAAAAAHYGDSEAADGCGEAVESGLVFVKRPSKTATGPAYDGPYPVLDEREKVILVKYGQSLDWVSRDRIKTYVGEGSPDVVCKKPRGRTRKS